MLDLGPQWLDRVAPLTGSVDRNSTGKAGQTPATPVAPLTGSVDRNKLEREGDRLVPRRSPHGERG